MFNSSLQFFFLKEFFAQINIRGISFDMLREAQVCRRARWLKFTDGNEHRYHATHFSRALLYKMSRKEDSTQKRP